MIEEIIFTKEECQWILNSCGEFIRSGITNDGDTIEITDYRTCYEYSFVNHTEISNFVLSKLQKFNVITLPDTLTVIRYEEGQYFKNHIDSGIGHEYRYKSVSIQLSESTDYKGGFLIVRALNERGESETLAIGTDIGSMVMFDSGLTHEVTPITLGIRYVLVFWLKEEDFSI